MNRPDYIVLIGTSAGGVKALTRLVTHFNKDMNAAVFLVMHLATSTVSNFLMNKLQPHTTLKCKIADENMPIEKGTLYIAPANGHLLVKEDVIQIGKGPAENRWKPSIDVLFRSAAASWSTRAIAIVLTGLLDDGTTGMHAIRKSGGICIVQDPNEAEFADMPKSVLYSMEVPYCLTLEGIGKLVMDITGRSPGEKLPAPPEVIAEAEIAEKVVISYANVEKLGQRDIFACPECGGGLFSIEESSSFTRYRCHVGHAFTESELSLKQNQQLESTLWVALRIMEERKTLLKKMERRSSKNGAVSSFISYAKKAEELEVHIIKLKELLFATQENTE